ncbi:SERTA domain-containing protein 3 [Marasmius crinis-equi]|uniref:SERTA domain-containing protein 3 n=1 Tax=Marasmius crinis-equi TaxID=585013 RepID=A0ABR3FI16_9AGAR
MSQPAPAQASPESPVPNKDRNSLPHAGPSSSPSQSRASSQSPVSHPKSSLVPPEDPSSANPSSSIQPLLPPPPPPPPVEDLSKTSPNPNLESNGSNATVLASTSKEPDAGATPKDVLNPAENAKNDVADKGDDDPELEKDKVATGTRKRRGNPGNFTGERLLFLEELLPAYLALPSKSKEREHWLRDFVPSFKELFPLEDYPMPEPKELAPLEVVDKEGLSAMSSKDRDLYGRKVKRRAATPDVRYTQAIKNWVIWRATSYRQKDDAAVKKILKDLDRDFEAPQKHSLDLYVMKHPDHKLAIKEMSTETCSKDRLARRRVAAKKYLEQLSEEERKKIEDGCQQQYEQATKQWNAVSRELSEEEKSKRQAQANFGGAIQPILDGIRRVTGLSVVLFAGEWKGGDTFSSIQLESSEEGTRNLSSVQSKVYSAFGQTFLAWLVDAKRAEKPADLAELRAIPRSNALEELMRLVSSPFSSRATSTQPPSHQATPAPSFESMPIPAIPAIPTSKPRDAFPPDPDDDVEPDETEEQPKPKRGRKKGTRKAKERKESGGSKKNANSSAKKARKSKGKGKARKQSEVEETSEDEDERMALEGEGDGDGDVVEAEPERLEQEPTEDELEKLRNFKPATTEEYKKMSYDEMMAYGRFHKSWAMWKAFGSTNPSLTAMIQDGEPKPRPKPKKVPKKPAAPAGPPRRSSRVSSSKSYKEPTEDEINELDELDEGIDQAKLDDEPENAAAVAENADDLTEHTNDATEHTNDATEHADANRKPDGDAAVNNTNPPKGTTCGHPLQHPGVWELALAFATSEDGFPVLEKQLEDLLGPAYSPEALQPLTTALFAAENDTDVAVSNVMELRDRCMAGQSGGVVGIEKSTAGDGVEGDEAMDVDESIKKLAHRPPMDIAPSVIETDVSDPFGHEVTTSDVSDPFGVPDPRVNLDRFCIPALQPFDEFSPSSITEETKIHIREYMSHLLDKDWGEEWRAVVFKWALLEERWVDLNVRPQPLPSGTRPEGFANWSKRGREKRPSGLKIPETASYDNLRSEWWAYWSDINPQWRQRAGQKVVMDVKDADGDWTELKRPGRDGLALLLVFLRWWHDLAPETEEAKKDWMEALENVYFAYSCVSVKALTAGEASRKRKAEDEGVRPCSSKRHGLRT